MTDVTEVAHATPAATYRGPVLRSTRSRPARRLTTALAGVAALATTVALIPATAPAAAAPPARRIVVTTWDTDEDFARGKTRGLTPVDGKLVLKEPAGVRGAHEFGLWRSPWVRPGYDLTELIPSWDIRTPGSSWAKIQVRGRTSDGRRSSWDTIAHWALKDTHVRRTSLDSQPDDLGRVSYDTWITPEVNRVDRWQVRVTLHRRTGTKAKPKLETVGAMASRLPATSTVTTSRPGAAPAALGRVLDVPSYSQMVHKGVYSQYDGGGEAWCSPTSTTMVLDHFGALPPPKAYRWVRKDYPDRVVAHLARMTYDVGFGGTGNWPFNTAFAASRTGNAFVTRLRDLREAERFIAAGIPLIASVTFRAGEMAGTPIRSTNGHVLVIVGFTEAGDVVVNDPAADSAAGVRRTYDRGQFENVWLRRGTSAGGSGGLVYVVHDDATPLPERSGNRNW